MRLPDRCPRDLAQSAVRLCVRTGCVLASALVAPGCAESSKPLDEAPRAASSACPDAGAGAAGAAGSSGGNVGQGSAESSDRTPIAGTVLASFDAAADVNAVQPSSAMQPGNLNAQTTVSWDAQEGDPNDGSLRVEVPFSAYNQQIDFQLPLPALSDLTGKVAYVRIKLGDGFNQDRSAPGGMIFYAQSGDDYAWGQAEWTNLESSTRGKWREYALEMSFPWREVSAGGVQGSSLAFDPARVRLLGLIIHTGGGGSSTIPPEPAVFHIDSFGYWDTDDL